MGRDARKDQFEWRNSIAPLLGDWVVLLAMKHRRAPLSVSSALWKALLRRGFLNDLDELGNVARRISFLGDERLLLAELRIRTATTPLVREILSKEDKITTEDRQQFRDAHIGRWAQASSLASCSRKGQAGFKSVKNPSDIVIASMVKADQVMCEQKRQRSRPLGETEANTQSR
jgi:hypothetical protein